MKERENQQGQQVSHLILTYSQPGNLSPTWSFIVTKTILYSDNVQYPL